MTGPFVWWFSLLVFLFWLAQTLDLVPGVLLKIPFLRHCEEPRPRKGAAALRGDEAISEIASATYGLPPRNDFKISVVFAARNEATGVGAAVRSLLSQDYPDFEVIAVNDRSTDGTLSILQSFSGDSRLKILDVRELPPAWLGKTHALYQGYLASTGEYLLFTDADVLFEPGTLSAAASVFCHSRPRSMSGVNSSGNLFQNGSPIKPFGDDNGCDHLVLFPKLLTESFIEKAFTQVFGLALFRRFRPWEASNPDSSAHMGLGAFNLIRRSAYEIIGTHQKLALEVVDDITLGRLVKENKLRQRVMSGVDLISVRWVGNAGGVVRSLEKNGFAGMGYNVSTLIAATFAILIVDVLPFLLLFFTGGAAFYFNLGTLVCLILISRAACRKMSGDWRLFWTHPSASLLLLFVLWRSAFLILRAGGVRWRDTFYPLQQLRH